MKTMPLDLCDILRHNPYPGRGIMLGNSRDLKTSVALYFIMGRSVNSRNRVFRRDGDSVHIDIYDSALVKDPTLILYRPMLKVREHLIVTNGDQTETISAALQNGASFSSALRTRVFEPDAPHFTPRISGMLDESGGDYCLSVLKAADARGDSCQRFFFEYEALAGRGHFIHTYQADRDPLPGFTGEPPCVDIPDDIENFARDVWASLNADNRVAMFLRRQDRAGKVTGLSVFNSHRT